MAKTKSPEVVSKSAPLKEESKSRLNVDSKEYQVPKAKEVPHSLTEALEGSDVKLPEAKKKNKKAKRHNARSSKSKKNRDQEPFVLDPIIGQQLMMGSEGQYAADGTYNPLQSLL